MKNSLLFFLLLLLASCQKQPVRPASSTNDQNSGPLTVSGIPPFDLSSRKGIDDYVRWADDMKAQGKTKILSDSMAGEMSTNKELWTYNGHNICLYLHTNTPPPQILKRWFYVLPSADKVVFLKEFHYDGVLYREDVYYYPSGTQTLIGQTRNSYNEENLAIKPFTENPSHPYGVEYHDDPNKINIMIRIYLDKL